jgi:hypothetical protein
MCKLLRLPECAADSAAATRSTLRAENTTACHCWQAEADLDGLRMCRGTLRRA